MCPTCLAAHRYIPPAKPMLSQPVSREKIMKSSGLRICLLAVAAWVACCSQVMYTEEVGSAVGASKSSVDLEGTWSGTFMPKHANANPFTITIVIAPDGKGALAGTSSLEADCVRNPRLEVSQAGSKVVLAGSDAEGNNIMFRGTPDTTGTVLTLNYVMNGSAS